MRAHTTLANGLVLTCACCALLLTGCGGKTELVRFNDRIARIFRELEPADRRFFETGYALTTDKKQKGKTTAAQSFQTAYDRLQEAVNKARKEAGALEVPQGTGVRKFYDTFLQVIKADEDILAKFTPVREAPEDKLRADRNQLRAWLDEAYKHRGQAWAELDQAQKEFAGENRIKLR